MILKFVKYLNFFSLINFLIYSLLPPSTYFHFGLFLNLNKADDVKTAENKFQKFDTTEAYYLDENFCLIGKLKLINILNKKGKAINFIEEKPLSLKSDMSVLEAIKVLKKFVGENIPILDNKRRVIGIISENDILKAYGEITTSIRNIEKN